MLEEKVFQFIACGLVFDVAGIALLGFAFFFKTKEAIIQEAGTYFNANPYVLKNLIATKMDGIAGSVLLMIGFLFQILGYVGLQNKDFVMVSYFLLLVFLLSYAINLRKRKVDTLYNNLVDTINKND